MRAVLPGRPEAKLQAVCTTSWNGRRLVIYISGKALVILGGPHELLQTIYHEDLGDSLDAVAADEATGKIAICTRAEVLIYRPYEWNKEVFKWSLQWSFELEEKSKEPCTLSWGAAEELLVGSDTLRLFQTADDETLIWRRQLSSPVISALFSHDARFIASTARYDRLVKIWRRLSFGSDDVRFDFSYLSHASSVTSLQWGRPSEHQQSPHVLYTLCKNKFRIWAAMDPHGLQVLQLWAEIDLQESIQPRVLEPIDRFNERYVFIINSQDLFDTTERAMKTATYTEDEVHTLEHLGEIVKRKPEICVILDRKGHMSAWGLEDIGCKNRTQNNIFNVAHVENFFIQFSSSPSNVERHMQLLPFDSCDPSPTYNLLVHRFDGRIEWLDGKIYQFLGQSTDQPRLQTAALWTGHDNSIKKIVRNISGKALISRTNDNEGLIWIQQHSKKGTGLLRRSLLSSPEHIHRSCILDEGDFVVNLHHESISLWDTTHSVSTEIASRSYEVQGKPLCLLQLPSPAPETPLRYLATISSSMKGIVWEIKLPFTSRRRNSSSRVRPSIREFCSFDLGHSEDLDFVLPIDPAGSTSVSSSFLDTFAADIAISYTHSGELRTWTARVDLGNQSVDWLATSIITTNVQNPTLASGTSIRKIALVDAERNGLTIWDSRSAQSEYDERFESHEAIGDLDWCSTPDSQSILAVGFPHSVTLLAQMRYDYINKGPAWAPIRDINIGDSTPHPIGDSTWLSNGNLVVGAGNQLFVYDKAIAASDDMISDLSVPIHKHSFVDLFDLVALLNGPLPIFHPQFLAQCILAGKFLQVQMIIVSLNQILKFFSNGDNLSSYLDLSSSDFYLNQDDMSIRPGNRRQSSISSFSTKDASDTLTEDVAAELVENLTKLAVPYITSREQIFLADIIESAALSQKHQRSMDDNAMRYLSAFRHHSIRQRVESQRIDNIGWREIVWAFHSESQDILTDLTSRHIQGKLTWTNARKSGACMWIRDNAALRTQFEIIARNEYTKTDEKNPIDCSLYYLALKKKNILIGLWRMAAWNREQSSTQKLLSNDFTDKRWKTAALKNAYALLGKRRFEYAAAFFLLAGNLQDAVNVCSNQLQDIQLAIAIARVYQGDSSPVLYDLLVEKVLPAAVFEGNRWLATWAFWMLGRRDTAVKALISPLHTLLESATPPNQSQQARSYLSADPALVVLYKQLREKTLQTLKGASQISPKEEWDFVMQTARLYDRMGCDLLALDLVRNWEFLTQTTPKGGKVTEDEVPDPKKLMRRRSSLVVVDMPTPKSPAGTSGKKMAGGLLGKAPPPKVFEEPSASSLLDSFGF